MPAGAGEESVSDVVGGGESAVFRSFIWPQCQVERRRRIDELTKATGLYPFLQRPAGKLSGGMKQKLGLCCALIHDPKLLILHDAIDWR